MIEAQVLERWNGENLNWSLSLKKKCEATKLQDNIVHNYIMWQLQMENGCYTKVAHDSVCLTSI